MTFATEVVAATALLTRLPVRTSGERAGSGAFGLVGAALGLGAAVPLAVLGPIAPLAAGALAVGWLAASSGALHLDGLADTADALAAPTAEAAERARRDPRSGPAGIAALAVTLLADAALLGALSERATAALVVVSVVVAVSASRAGAALASVLPTVAVREGFGEWFARRTSPVTAIAGAAVPVVLATIGWLALDRPWLLAVPVAALVAGAVLGALLSRLRRGLDGDAFGAVVEGGFLAALVAAVLVV
jgi:adenosylcobinamide-GDP ribazoletransferase